MKKRKQHYVWRKYLKAWACSDLIWCCREGKIFRSNLVNIGQVRDFYRLKELSSEDIASIERLAIDPTKSHLRGLARGWLDSLGGVFKIKRMIGEMGIDVPGIDVTIEEIINNAEEELHAGIESRAAGYIDSILDGDIGFYQTEQGRIDFTYYLCVQYFRTRKIQESILARFSANKSVNMDNIWYVLRHIYAANSAWVLFAETDRFRMHLIRNLSDVPLITGDQPVVNTYAVDRLGVEPVKDLELYYPVSPALAVLISEKNEYLHGWDIAFSGEDARLHNGYIARSSHEQIYSHSKESLESYCV